MPCNRVKPLIHYVPASRTVASVVGVFTCFVHIAELQTEMLGPATDMRSMFAAIDWSLHMTHDVGQEQTHAPQPVHGSSFSFVDFLESGPSGLFIGAFGYDQPQMQNTVNSDECIKSILSELRVSDVTFEVVSFLSSRRAD